MARKLNYHKLYKIIAFAENTQKRHGARIYQFLLADSFLKSQELISSKALIAHIQNV